MTLLQSIKAALSTPLRGFHADRSGATMTEFIITLPIFIMIFAGVANLSRLNKAVVRTSGVAYSQMWDKTIKVQEGKSSNTHDSVSHSGSAIKTNMNKYKYKQPEDSVREIVRHETNSHGTGLARLGTLGESDARVHSARSKIKFRGIHTDVTSNIKGVVGDSDLGNRLFDDSASARTTTVSGSIGPRTRMHFATGAYYGEEMGFDEQIVKIAGQDFEVHQYYNTLVAPRWGHEKDAAQIVRGALNEVDAYNKLLGIAKTQRLPEKSQTVSKIKGTMQ